MAEQKNIETIASLEEKFSVVMSGYEQECKSIMRRFSAPKYDEITNRFASAVTLFGEAIERNFNSQRRIQDKQVKLRLLEVITEGLQSLNHIGNLDAFTQKLDDMVFDIPDDRSRITYVGRTRHDMRGYAGRY